VTGPEIYAARANECAHRLLSTRPNDPEAIYHAGVILALVAISDAVLSISWPMPPNVTEPEAVPYDETRAGWSWP
jgi:hypothetical protein